MFDIWSQDEPLAVKQYKNNNYLIRTFSNGGGYCAIFCSSNNIWFPNIELAFKTSLIEKNRYEWTNYHLSCAEKEIFIRDIYKSWYVTGINVHLDTIDKIVQFLKKETEGLKPILIGSSAGGYIASLLGALLNADYVIAFSAQFELRNKWAMNVNSYLKKYELDSKRSYYYDLKPILNKSKTPVYYIVPIKSETDKYHYDYIKNVPCIKPIIFNSRRHGIVMLKKNVIRFLSLSKDEINKIYEYNRGKEVSNLTFSLQLVGVKATFISVAEELMMYLKLLVKKIKES